MVREFRVSQIPKSFRFALRGLWHVLRTEQNLRIHLAAAIVAVGLGIYFQISGLEFAVVLLATGLVIGTEVLNTVIEDFLDIIHPRHHPAVRRIKDALAGAVLAAAVVAVGVGLLIFLPYIFAAIQ